MIRGIGIGGTLKSLWDLKLKFETLPIPGATVIADKLLFLFNPIFPCALPSEVTKLTSEMDHHLIINVADYGGGESKRFHERLGKFLAKGHPVKARNASRPAAHVPLIAAPMRSAA